MTTEQLLKLFYFPNWLKYQVEAGNFANETAAIQEELNTYSDEGFALRDDFKSPIFMPIMLAAPYTLGEYSETITRNSITDIGICETVNGYSMKATYKVGEAMKYAHFDQRLPESCLHLITHTHTHTHLHNIYSQG